MASFTTSHWLKHACLRSPLTKRWPRTLQRTWPRRCNCTRSRILQRFGKKKGGKKKGSVLFHKQRQKPPAPFSPPVDLDQTLSSLQEKSFGSDFEFHQALRSVFLQLHDAHTNFYAPVPMQFTFLLPFNVISYADSSNGTMVLEVASILNHAEEWNFNVSSLIGARILTIDSVPALQYVTNFAQTSVGLAKDPQVRCSREE